MANIQISLVGSKAESIPLCPLFPVNVPGIKIFRVNSFFTEINQPNKIKFRFGRNFKKHFIVSGKVELNVPDATLQVYELETISKNEDVVSVLKDKKGVKSYLFYLAWLLTQQSRGQHGVLPTSGEIVVFYAADTYCRLWAIRCQWLPGSNEWFIEATLRDCLSGYHKDYQIFPPFELLGSGS